jgi:hypothetical protein
MTSESMGRLISVHRTPPKHLWASLALILSGLVFPLFGLVLGQALCLIYGVGWFLFFFMLIGVPCYPAQRVEIYEKGMLYRTFWQSQSWHWSDFIGIRSGTWYLYLFDTRGESVRLHTLSDWQQFCQQIYKRAGESIHEKSD